MNAFQQLLKSSGGHPPRGTWILSAHALIPEAVGHAGFDWAVVDMEHAPFDVGGVAAMPQAVSGTEMLLMVRVPWNEAVVGKRVPDAGATTVQFPFVQDAGEAARAMAATRCPPEGVRSMSRASRFDAAPHCEQTANRGIGGTRTASAS